MYVFVSAECLGAIYCNTYTCLDCGTFTCFFSMAFHLLPVTALQQRSLANAACHSKYHTHIHYVLEEHDTFNNLYVYLQSTPPRASILFQHVNWRQRWYTASSVDRTWCMSRMITTYHISCLRGRIWGVLRTGPGGTSPGIFSCVSIFYCHQGRPL